MPEIILFEDTHAANLYPFHLVDGVQEVRHGAFTQRERWSNVAAQLDVNRAQKVLHINARWIPDADTVKVLSDLENNTALVHGHVLLASALPPEQISGLDKRTLASTPELLEHANILFTGLKNQLQADVPQLQSDWDLKPFTPVAPTHVFGTPSDILVSDSALIKAATLDATHGPIVIGPGAELEAGCHIQGPVLIHAHATIRMGAFVKGATVIGPHCKVGGEISNVHFQGWANKAHDGFLGNSVIGKWCNLGAGTCTSNLKNTYGEVRQWSVPSQTMRNSGLQFCGLLMGDHSKCGIGTTFNTGTVIGPASVIFDAGYPPKHVPAFSWLNAKTGESTLQDLNKMMGTAEKVMARRNVSLSAQSKVNLSALHAIRSNET